LSFSLGTNSKKLTLWVSLYTFVSFLATLYFTTNFLLGHPKLELTWVKGVREESAIYERWNSHSRIKITGDLARAERPFGWGLSPIAPMDPLPQLRLKIDSSALTVIPNFDGTLTLHEYLKYDISNLVHYIRPDSKVAVIGVGGGEGYSFGARLRPAVGPGHRGQRRDSKRSLWPLR